MDISTLMADPIMRVSAIGVLVWGTIEMTMTPFEKLKVYRPLMAIAISLALSIALTTAGMAGAFENTAQAILSGVIYGLASAIGAKAGNDRLFNAFKKGGNTKLNQ